MKLVVLGSGTCTPSATRASSGYWIEAGVARVRLDCGAGTVHAMAKHGLPWETVTHQVITHFHIDHCGELPALLMALKYGRTSARSTPLTLVGPVGLESLLRDLLARYDTRLLEQDFPVVFRELAPGAALDLGLGVRLSVAKTKHTAESLAVRIDSAGQSIGYTGDTAPTPTLAGFFDRVDLLVAECSFLIDKKSTLHLTAAECADLAQDSGAAHLLATHFYFDPAGTDLPRRLSSRFRGQITLAQDGLVL